MHKNPLFSLLLVILGASLATAPCATIEFAVPPDPAVLAQYKHDVQAGVFTIKGSVLKPGQYPVKPNQKLTISEALKLAGGANHLGHEEGDTDLGEIHLSRLKDGKMVEFSLNLLGKKPDQDFLIHPGDTIDVLTLAL